MKLVGCTRRALPMLTANTPPQEHDKFMDALKTTSLMLFELRTAQLPPRSYYQLCMSLEVNTGELVLNVGPLPPQNSPDNRQRYL